MNLPRKEPVAEAERTLRRVGWFGASAILAYLASFKVLLHLLTNGNYGYFRDELYYVAAGERLALGYVDFPPFVTLITAFTRLLLGDSTVALRFLPALTGALVVVLAGLMARELGGGRFAQGLAALAALVAPSFLVMGTFISMDAFDQLFWVSAAYVLILILKQNRPRLWLLFGLIAGLGVLTKITMLYFGLRSSPPCCSRQAAGTCSRRGRGWEARSPPCSCSLTSTGRSRMAGLRSSFGWTTGRRWTRPPP
jgi:hypothetical protein